MDVKLYDQDAPETKKTLTGSDYLDMNITDLVEHEDFSAHAYRVVAAITRMTSKQLEKLNVITTVESIR